MSAAGSNPAPSAGSEEPSGWIDVVSDPTSHGPSTTDYRFSGPLVVRFLGAVTVLAALVLVGLTLLVLLLELPGVLVAVGAVLLAATTAGAALVLLRPPWVVRLDDRGYRVRWVRSAGLRQAPWRDVADVGTRRVGVEPCVVLRLHDGRSTAVPVSLLAGDPGDFLDDVGRRLEGRPR